MKGTSRRFPGLPAYPENGSGANATGKIDCVRLAKERAEKSPSEANFFSNKKKNKRKEEKITKKQSGRNNRLKKNLLRQERTNSPVKTLN